MPPSVEDRPGSLEIGDIAIVPIVDATERVALGDVFPAVGIDRWRDCRHAYPQLFTGPQEWLLTYACYLLEAGETRILVDLGIGPDESPLCAHLGRRGGTLLQGLESLGVDPGDIDVVVLSHLHPDHLGWATRTSSGGRVPTFPNARYLCHAADWDTFEDPDEATRALFPYPYFDELVGCLSEHDRLDLMHGDLEIAPGVRVEHTPGHTPGSVTVVATSGEAEALLWADVVAHPAQIAEPDRDFIFDMDPVAARRRRRRLIERACADGSVTAAAHHPGFGVIERVDGVHRWQPIGALEQLMPAGEERGDTSDERGR